MATGNLAMSGIHDYLFCGSKLSICVSLRSSAGPVSISDDLTEAYRRSHPDCVRAYLSLNLGKIYSIPTRSSGEAKTKLWCMESSLHLDETLAVLVSQNSVSRPPHITLGEFMLRRANDKDRLNDTLNDCLR